jgi:hypothetical protein
MLNSREEKYGWKAARSSPRISTTLLAAARLKSTLAPGSRRRRCREVVSKPMAARGEYTWRRES